jgi:hypothetical protein
MNLNKIVRSKEEFNEICCQNADIKNINFHIESKIVFFGANKAENSSWSVSNLNDEQDKESKERNILVVLAHHGMNKSFILDHLTPQVTESAADFFAQTIWRQKGFLNENNLKKNTNNLTSDN